VEADVERERDVKRGEAERPELRSRIAAARPMVRRNDQSGGAEAEGVSGEKDTARDAPSPGGADEADR
jgi:hypothetical protein